ncbi:UNVERIFIED_CONTAM: hypothetical protein K2H54_046353 [Gekko kuhli]
MPTRLLSWLAALRLLEEMAAGLLEVVAGLLNKAVVRALPCTVEAMPMEGSLRCLGTAPRARGLGHHGLGG